MVLGELGFQSSWRRIAINHLSLMVFLGRMKYAASIDLFRSIESFISSSSFQSMDHDTSEKKIQEFFIAAMETVFKDYLLWANATDENTDLRLGGFGEIIREKKQKLFIPK